MNSYEISLRAKYLESIFFNFIHTSVLPVFDWRCIRMECQSSLLFDCCTLYFGCSKAEPGELALYAKRQVNMPLDFWWL